MIIFVCYSRFENEAAGAAGAEFGGRYFGGATDADGELTGAAAKQNTNERILQKIHTKVTNEFIFTN